MAYTPLFRLLNILLFFFFPLLRLYRLFYVSTSLPEDLSRHYPCDPRIINAVLARTFRGNLRAPSNYGRFKGETLGTIPGNDILQPFNEMEKRSRSDLEMEKRTFSPSLSLSVSLFPESGVLISRCLLGVRRQIFLYRRIALFKY